MKPAALYNVRSSFSISNTSTSGLSKWSWISSIAAKVNSKCRSTPPILTDMPFGRKLLKKLSPFFYAAVRKLPLH